MSHARRGTARRPSAGRRFIAEFLRQARHVPLVTARRDFDLAGLVAVRAEMMPKVSWVALFARAYALAARQHDALRQSWTTFPRPRLYTHPVSACLILVEREWEGEEVVLGGKVHEPEVMGLADIDRNIGRFQSAPVWSISSFRRMLRIGRCPSLIRRFILWSSLHCSGFKRSKRFGTFIVSSLGNFGCETIAPTMPLTGYLTFGPISANGRVSVSLTFDHRVMDGRRAARALVDMERLFNTFLVSELRAVATTRNAALDEKASTRVPDPEMLALG